MLEKRCTARSAEPIVVQSHAKNCISKIGFPSAGEKMRQKNGWTCTPRILGKFALCASLQDRPAIRTIMQGGLIRNGGQLVPLSLFLTHGPKRDAHTHINFMYNVLVLKL